MVNKKSQGLSINMIIIAAIGLIVLVILLAIFTGRINIFNKDFLGTCQEQGGICSQKGECNNPDFPRKVFAKGCPNYERNNEGIYIEKRDVKEGQCCLKGI